jgi:hypothetical protein
MSGEQITQAKLLIWAKTTQQILQVQTKSGFWHTVKTCLQFALARETRKHLALPKTPRTWSNPRKNGMTFTSTSRSYRIIRNIVSTCINIIYYIYIWYVCVVCKTQIQRNYAKLCQAAHESQALPHILLPRVHSGRIQGLHRCKCSLRTSMAIQAWLQNASILAARFSNLYYIIFYYILYYIIFLLYYIILYYNIIISYNYIII